MNLPIQNRTDGPRPDHEHRPEQRPPQDEQSPLVGRLVEKLRRSLQSPAAKVAAIAGGIGAVIALAPLNGVCQGLAILGLAGGMAAKGLVRELANAYVARRDADARFTQAEATNENSKRLADDRTLGVAAIVGLINAYKAEITARTARQDRALETFLQSGSYEGHGTLEAGQFEGTIERARSGRRQKAKPDDQPTKLKLFTGS